MTDAHLVIGFVSENPCGVVTEEKHFTVLQKAAPQEHVCTTKDVEDAAKLWRKKEDGRICLEVCAVVECQDCRRRYFYKDYYNGFWHEDQWMSETNRSYRKRMKRETKGKLI